MTSPWRRFWNTNSSKMQIPNVPIVYYRRHLSDNFTKQLFCFVKARENFSFFAFSHLCISNLKLFKPEIFICLDAFVNSWASSSRHNVFQVLDTNRKRKREIRKCTVIERHLTSTWSLHPPSYLLVDGVGVRRQN